MYHQALSFLPSVTSAPGLANMVMQVKEYVEERGLPNNQEGQKKKKGRPDFRAQFPTNCNSTSKSFHLPMSQFLLQNQAVR